MDQDNVLVDAPKTLIHTLKYEGEFTKQEAIDNTLPQDIQDSMFEHLYSRDDRGVLKKFPQLRLYKHSTLVDTKYIVKKTSGSADYNTAWIGDGSPKAKEVHQSIEEAGYRLRKYAPIALFKSNDSEKYFLLDGRTRFQKFDDYKYRNIIADVYEANSEEFSHEDIMFARERFAGAANIQGFDERGVMRQKDIVHLVSRAYKNGWIKKSERVENGETIIEPDKESVRDTILSITGTSKFQERTIEKLINQIINSALDIETGKRYWENEKKVVEWLTNSTEDRFYKNTDEIHYQIFEVSDARRSIEVMTSIAKKYPTKKIRMILYKKFCDSSNPVNDFKESVVSYCEKIENIMNDIGKIFFSGCNHNLNTSRVKFYGVVPSLASMGSLDRLFLYEGSGTDFDSMFTQKEPKEVTTSIEIKQSKRKFLGNRYSTINSN